mgnify:CR=1 FL=1
MKQQKIHYTFSENLAYITETLTINSGSLNSLEAVLITLADSMSYRTHIKTSLPCVVPEPPKLAPEVLVVIPEVSV